MSAPTLTPGLAPTLAYVETSLPAPTPRERLALAVERALALELVDDGRLDPEPYRRAGARLSGLQAYRLHEDHPLHRDRQRRREAERHVASALETAARLGAPRVVTICAYGHELADSPFERCLDFFAPFESRCRELGVKLLIEPLSPAKTGALTDPYEVVRLLATLAAPEAFALLLDVGHLADGGTELEAFFAEWEHPVEELQLRGPASAPPDPELPVERWLQGLPAPPAVVAVEHRGPIDPGALDELLDALREAGLA